MKISAFAGCLALPIAALSIPAIWLGYVGYRWGSAMTRFAFRRPNITMAGILAVSLMSYAACTHRRELTHHVAKAIVSVSGTASTHGLEAKLDAGHFENATLERAVAPYQQQLNEHAPEAHTRQRAANSPARTRQGSRAAETQSYNFYFVRPGDTLAGIASEISGDAKAYITLMADNHIANPRAMPAGTLLRIRKRLCTRYNARVYERIPELSSVMLPGDRAIHETFPRKWKEVIALNKQLGLNYTDTHPTGERVVYYRN